MIKLYKKTTNFLQEFSIPLIIGVISALIVANLAPDTYHHIIHFLPFGDFNILSHKADLHFLVNDIFMAFFFGIAAKEITESCLPGGALNPIRKAINPLFGTLGGVFGPIAVFFIILSIFYSVGIYDSSNTLLKRGWGIPTATDIALAWLVARAVYGKGHPAINFLLLLAIVDDAIGLGIIAVFYGDPQNPVEPIYLLLVVLAMSIAFIFRKIGIKKWPLYIFISGSISWVGLLSAHLHPALALVFIVPFLPAPSHDTGIFSTSDEIDQNPTEHLHEQHSALHQFEHQLKFFVDFGLFFFAFANAGVQFSSIGPITFLILASLVIGKTIGISLCSFIAIKIGFPLPDGMNIKDLLMAGFIAALGLTVALFVSGAAYTDIAIQGEAKMGALLSGFVGIIAIIIGRLFLNNQKTK